MPRPRLYHTPEEKQAANRAKSQRHYHKHKSDIQLHRQATYKKKSKSLNVTLSNTGTCRSGHPSKMKEPATLSGVSSGLGDRHLLYWSQRADRVAINFNKLTNNSAFDFVEGIFNIYQKTQDKDVIRDAIVDTSRLQKSIHWYEAEILQLAGVGTEWKQAASISKHVCDVVKWLEEILCLAMVDVEELSTAYKHQSLMYQA